MISFLISLISFTIAVSLCYTVIRMWREREADVCVLRSYTIEAFSIAFWCIGYTFMYNTYDHNEVVLYYKISSVGWTLLPSANMYFVWRLHLSLTERRGNILISSMIFAPYPFFLAAALNGKILATGFVRIPFGWIEYIPVSSVMSLLYTAALVLSIAACFAFLIVRYRNTSLKKHRMQIMLILVPAAVIGIIGVCINILSAAFNMPRTPALAHLLMGGWTLFLGYLVMHYQVLNIHPKFVMESILYNMHDMVILTGRLHNVVMANSAAEKILGYSAEEIFNSDAAGLFDDGNRHFVRASAHKEEGFFEVEFISKSGQLIPCRCSVQPVMDNFTDPVGYVIFARDIRDMKRLEVLTDEMKLHQEQLRVNLEKIEQKNDLMHKELELARQIQHSLVPQLSPAVPGVSFSMLYQPVAEVGGDLYDFVRFNDDKKIGLFISDVSGHGVPAALVAGMIKTLLMTSGDYREQPDAMLSFINQRITGQISSNFVTAFYCVYDIHSRILQYARAGHPYPYLMRKGKITRLTSKGIMLGFSEKIKPEVCSVELFPGDKLLLFTDGLLETVDSTGAFFEDTKLDAVLSAHEWKPVVHFTRAVFADLNMYKGDLPFDDDVCLLCMEVL